MAHYHSQHLLNFDTATVERIDNTDDRIKKLEDKFDFLLKKLNIQIPSAEIKYSNWQEFLDNLNIKVDEDTLFVLENSFALPQTLKNETLKNENGLLEEIEKNRHVEKMLNRHGYQSGLIDFYTS